MQWGRQTNKKRNTKNTDIPYSANGIIIIGTLICTLFFTTALFKHDTEPSYPASLASAAQSAFRLDHASLAALLSLDEYFPEEAVSAGAFDIVGEGERWSFSRYLQDALYTVLFGDIP